MDWIALIAISSVVAWVLLLAEAVVLFALVRQIGVLHTRVAPRGSRDPGRDGPQVGTQPPQMELLAIGGTPLWIGTQMSQPAVYLFVSLTCTLCQDVLRSVPALHQAYANRLFVRVLVRGDPPDAARIKERHRLPDAVPVAAAHQVFEVYGVDSTPWLLVLGSDGRVLSRGIVNSLEQMEVAIELVLPTDAGAVPAIVPTAARMEA